LEQWKGGKNLWEGEGNNKKILRYQKVNFQNGKGGEMGKADRERQEGGKRLDRGGHDQPSGEGAPSFGGYFYYRRKKYLDPTFQKKVRKKVPKKGNERGQGGEKHVPN